MTFKEWGKRPEEPPYDCGTCGLNLEAGCALDQYPDDCDSYNPIPNNAKQPPTIKIGPYEISKYPPIPHTEQVNVLWLCKEDGEGMSVDLDKLWEDF